jgi:hypothetical protein
MNHDIVYDGGARLRDKGGRGFSLNVPDVRPCTYIRPRGDIVYLFNPHLPKPREQTPPILAVGAVGWGGKHGDGHPSLQIFQKTLGIIIVTAAFMPASLDAGAAHNTSVEIHLYLDLTAFAVNNVRALNRANPDTSVAAYAFGNIIGYQLAHINPARLS